MPPSGQLGARLQEPSAAQTTSSAIQPAGPTGASALPSTVLSPACPSGEIRQEPSAGSLAAGTAGWRSQSPTAIYPPLALSSSSNGGAGPMGQSGSSGVVQTACVSSTRGKSGSTAHPGSATLVPVDDSQQALGSSSGSARASGNGADGSTGLRSQAGPLQPAVLDQEVGFLHPHQPASLSPDAVASTPQPASAGSLMP